MPRLAIFNLFLGFCAIFIAACVGPFLALEITQNYLQNPAELGAWDLSLLKSSHGHTTLFGVLHICLGLTFPYTRLSVKFKFAQTCGLGLGTLAMSFLLVLRAYAGPYTGFDGLGLVTGLCLALALVSLGLQCYGLCAKLLR